MALMVPQQLVEEEELETIWKTRERVTKREVVWMGVGWIATGKPPRDDKTLKYETFRHHL
jgi:hypothetical protein